MEKLDGSYVNEHKHKTNINHFAPLFKPENEEGNKHRTKPNTPIIVPSEYEEEK